MLPHSTPAKVEIASPVDPRLPEVLQLIQRSFAYMEGVIDPPSSIHRFDLPSVERHAALGEMVVVGSPPIAAMVMQEKPGTLYLGKIAVAATARGQGLARQMVAFATNIARARNLPNLTLQSRVELTGNHATFRALGFTETGRTTHEGYQKPTSITFTMAV